MRTTRKALIFLTIVLIATSCGYQITKSTTTTTTITTTTTTTINYGRDCNLTVEKKLQEMRSAAKEAGINAMDGNSGPTSSEYKEHTRALRALRSYVRTLEIPTISVEQNKFVESLQNYLSAYNTYIESGKKNLSVNDYIIPLSDADTDFFDAWNATCG